MYWFLAQEGQQEVPIWGHPIFLMVIIFGLMWFMFIRPQRKQEAARRAMIAGVRKNDRIVTTGGILGVVTNVKEQDEEVTIRIDDARDVKVRVLRNNIAAVLNRKDAD
jgi:preprotein translocase subunit YajC